MESKKRSSIKAISYTAFHVGVASLLFSYLIYIITGKWENEYLEPITIGFMLYVAWEIIGYFIFERIWNNRWLRRIK
jgi:hypothetical protein